MGSSWWLYGQSEIIIQTVERETLEETGYEIKAIKWLTIRDNPDRPGGDRQNISFVFFCQATQKVGNPDSESSEQKWFDLDDLPPKEQLAFDHYDDIELYKRYKKENLVLPILK
jgi:8-oxo-dGTP diphosphatase